jgi:hypothetical protein
LHDKIVGLRTGGDRQGRQRNRQGNKSRGNAHKIPITRTQHAIRMLYGSSYGRLNRTQLFKKILP